MDNFCKELKKYFEHNCIPCEEGTASFDSPPFWSFTKWNHDHLCPFPPICLSDIPMVLHKAYPKEIPQILPKACSLNRFVELMPYAAIPLTLFVQFIGFKTPCTGIGFVASTTLNVCDNHRIPQHKVFERMTKRGKSSMGWFYGFKLHLVIHDRGEILRFCLTPDNVDDRNQKVMRHLTKSLFEKLFAELLEKGIVLLQIIKIMSKFYACYA